MQFLETCLQINIVAVTVQFEKIPALHRRSCSRFWREEDAQRGRGEGEEQGERGFIYPSAQPSTDSNMRRTFLAFGNNTLYRGKVIFDLRGERSHVLPDSISGAHTFRSCTFPRRKRAKPMSSSDCLFGDIGANCDRGRKKERARREGVYIALSECAKPSGPAHGQCFLCFGNDAIC
jgi:hypothetical protein